METSTLFLKTKKTICEKTWIKITGLLWRHPWWRHQIEIFYALLTICAGNSSVVGKFPTQRPVMRSFDVFFNLRLNKQLSKQTWARWFETLSRPLWRHCNECIISIRGITVRLKKVGLCQNQYLSWKHTHWPTTVFDWCDGRLILCISL